jgi:hypothetical protein
MAALEEILYGKDDEVSPVVARLPMPEEIITLLNAL